jgi:outer membrane immunogenic protein
MKKNAKTVAAIVGLAILTATPVLAADMAMKAPPSAPVADPSVNWTGFYLGGNAGGAWATTSDSNAFFGATTGDFPVGARN